MEVGQGPNVGCSAKGKKKRSYQGPHYAVFSSYLLLHPSWVQISLPFGHVIKRELGEEQAVKV
jgi:hypothetical protein